MDDIALWILWEMLMKAANPCAFRFVFGNRVWVLDCVRALLRRQHCPDDLFLAQIVAHFSSSSHLHLACKQLRYSSLRRIGKSLVCEIRRLDVTKNWSCQFFVSTTPCGREWSWQLHDGMFPRTWRVVVFGSQSLKVILSCAWNFDRVCAVLFITARLRGLGTILGMAHVLCSEESSRCQSDLQEFARLVEFSFRQNYQGSAIAIANRLHNLKFLLPQVTSNQRRIPRPRHATRYSPIITIASRSDFQIRKRQSCDTNVHCLVSETVAIV